MTKPVEHVALPVAGFRPTQSDADVQKVNANKITEERILRTLDAMMADGVSDKRWTSIARTHFEQAFMAMNRAVFQPGRIQLMGDD